MSNYKHSDRFRFRIKFIIRVKFSYTFNHTRKVNFCSQSTKSKTRFRK